DPSEERRAAQKIPLDRLDLDPNFRATLFKLGIKTVGALLSLPPVGLRERFGPKAYHLYRMAAGELWAPLEPCPPEEPVRQRRIRARAYGGRISGHARATSPCRRDADPRSRRRQPVAGSLARRVRRRRCGASEINQRTPSRRMLYLGTSQPRQAS